MTLPSRNAPQIVREDLLYVVLWSPNAKHWHMVKDDLDRGVVPAAYIDLSDAEQRRRTMQAQFPANAYRVVGYTAEAIR